MITSPELPTCCDTRRLLRRPDPEEWDELDSVLSEAHGREMPSELRQSQRQVFEFDRALGWYEDDLLCGIAAVYSLRMSVPGGLLPVAGVTWVGVRPTHRRRGIMTALIRRQLDQLHASGEAVAALWTTDPRIYGRFGYGVASYELRLTIPQDARALDHVPQDNTLRLYTLPPVEALPLTEPVYAASVPLRPGACERNDAWARHVIVDPPELRAGATVLRCVIAADHTRVRGYLRYATVPRSENGRPANVVRLRDVCALDPAACVVLWRHVLGLDLVSSIEIPRLPVDDPLVHLLPDVRAATPTIADQLHLRVVDVGRALSARSYAAAVNLVIDVDDRFCAWNHGRWRLHGEPAGATCDRTRAEPDLGLASSALAAAFLGGTSLAALAAAGLVWARDKSILATASRAFISDLAPFCPHRY